MKALGERHLHGVRRKLAELGRLELALAELVERCDAGRTVRRCCAAEHRKTVSCAELPRLL